MHKVYVSLCIFRNVVIEVGTADCCKIYQHLHYIAVNRQALDLSADCGSVQLGCMKHTCLAVYLSRWSKLKKGCGLQRILKQRYALLIGLVIQAGVLV